MRLVDHHPLPARVDAGYHQDGHVGYLAQSLHTLSGALRIIDVKDDRVHAARQNHPSVQRARESRADLSPESGQRSGQGLVAGDDENADRPVIVGRRHGIRRSPLVR